MSTPIPGDITSRRGRLPAVVFADNTDPSTVIALLSPGWRVRIVTRLGALHDLQIGPSDSATFLVGTSRTDTGWGGPSTRIAIADIARIILT